MHETNANGRTTIYMPKDRQTAAHQLGKLSALAAAREWERAALVALMVKSAGRGRPKNVTRNDYSEAQKQYNIKEFTRVGIYGFRTENAVRAYLKAWSLSGLQPPAWGEKIELPATEFPDAETLYGRLTEPDPAPELGQPEPEDESDDSDEAEDEPEASPLPSQGRERPIPRGADPLSGFLKVLDRMDPVQVIAGQTPEQISLLVKTMESWLESLREAASEIDDEDAA